MAGLLVGLLCSPLRAQEVTLEEAVRSAVEKRPYVQVGKAQLEVSEAAAGEALSGYLPQLKVEETFVRTNEPGTSLFISLNQQQLELSPTADAYNYPPTRSDFETRIQLDQTVLNAGQYYSIRQANSHVDASRARIAWLRESAAFEAFNAYLDVQRAHAARAWAQSSLEEARELLRLAELREKNGIGLKSDTLRARVYEAEAERRHLRATNDLTLTRKKLAVAMGQECREVDIESPLNADSFSLSEADGMERADLQAIGLTRRAARHQLSSARAQWLPTLGVSASYSGHDPDAPGFDADSWMVSGRLSWDLFDGLRRERSQQKARAQLRATSEELRDATTMAELALQEAELRAEEARLHFTMAERAMLAAEESYHLLRERYASGLSDLSDLLGVQSALDRARADLVEAEAGLVLARGNVYYQGGQFLSTLLPDEVESK